MATKKPVKKPAPRGDKKSAPPASKADRSAKDQLSDKDLSRVSGGGIRRRQFP